MSFDVRAERHRGRLTVAVHGEIDVATYRRLRDTIRLGEGRRTKEIVVDLTQADFLDSSGISVLFGAARRAHEADRTLTVVVGDPHVQRVLELVRMDSVATLESVATVGSAAPLAARIA